MPASWATHFLVRMSMWFPTWTGDGKRVKEKKTRVPTWDMKFRWFLYWTQADYQSDVGSGLPQGPQSSARCVLKCFISRQSTQRGEFQDEGSHPGGTSDGCFSGTDAVQQVHRAVWHPSGSLERWKHSHTLQLQDVIHLMIVPSVFTFLILTCAVRVFVPGRSFLAASSAILSKGPEQGQPGSSSIPALPASRWADSRPPTTTTHTQTNCQTSGSDSERNQKRLSSPYLWCWFQTRMRWRQYQNPRCLGGARPRAETQYGSPTPAHNLTLEYPLLTASLQLHYSSVTDGSAQVGGISVCSASSLLMPREILLFRSYQQSVESIDQRERETVEKRQNRNRFPAVGITPSTLGMCCSRMWWCLRTCPRCPVHHRWAGGAHRRGRRCRGNCCRRGRTWTWCAAWNMKPVTGWRW